MLTSETFCRAGINVFKKCSRLTDCSEIQTHNYLVRKRKWPAWLNGWLFVYELNGCGFESHCSHLNFRYQPCFEQGVPWHSGNYIVTWLEHTVIVNLPPPPPNLRDVVTNKGWQEQIWNVYEILSETFATFL